MQENEYLIQFRLKKGNKRKIIYSPLSIDNLPYSDPMPSDEMMMVSTNAFDVANDDCGISTFAN